LFATAAAFAAWERHVSTDVGAWTDLPSPHILSYFARSACVAQAPNDHLPECYKSRTKLVSIGRIGKLAIYDLNYYFDNAYEPPDTIGAKSILVRSAPGFYHEIYYRTKSQVDDAISATQILTLGKERILLARFYGGGNSGSFLEECFDFSGGSAKLISLDPIFRAAEKQVPEDSVIFWPTAHFNFEAGTWEAETEPKNLTTGAKISCCTGRVTVEFMIENGDFAARRASYDRN
jgi:hypothetical protein